MHNKRLIILTLTAILCAAQLTAQKIVWSIDFSTLFENREGGDAYLPDGTVFFTRLAPEVGISLMDNQHQIRGGVDWRQPVGNGWRDYKISPTLYYRFHRNAVSLSFGMIPRRYMTEKLHRFLWSDDMAYTQPNIRGVLFQYQPRNGYIDVALDWRQLQSLTQREAFTVNMNTRWAPGGKAFLVGGRLQLNHLAKRKDAPEGEGVNDDIAVNGYVGVDLSRHTALDSLMVQVGAVAQMERSRALDKWEVPAGALIDAVAQWRWLGVKETLSVGKNLFPLYHLFGEELNMGSPFYQAKLYSRTNVYGEIFANQYINLTVSLDFHYTKEAFHFWQRLAVRAYIDDNLWRNKAQKDNHAHKLCEAY